MERQEADITVEEAFKKEKRSATEIISSDIKLLAFLTERIILNNPSLKNIEQARKNIETLLQYTT
jgi:hypothetical protein